MCQVLKTKTITCKSLGGKEVQSTLTLNLHFCICAQIAHLCQVLCDPPAEIHFSADQPRWVTQTPLPPSDCQHRHTLTERRENRLWEGRTQRHSWAPLHKALSVLPSIRTFNKTQKVEEAPCWHTHEPRSCDLCSGGWAGHWRHRCYLRAHTHTWAVSAVLSNNMDKSSVCVVSTADTWVDREIQRHSRSVYLCACANTCTEHVQSMNECVCVRAGGGFGFFSHELY